jgi:peptide/nickel transport system substrate-binding protein
MVPLRKWKLADLITATGYRRPLLLLVLAGLAFSGMVILLGCGPGASTPAAVEKKEGVVTEEVAPTPTPAPTVPETPQTIRISSYESTGPKESMDPAFNWTDTDATRDALVYERLVYLNENYEAEPVLAESWEVDETGTVWTFHLHRGVKFHDGSDFTAADVVFTYRRLLDPELGSPALPNLSMLDPEGIEALDDYTVRFTLPAPVAELPQAITTRHTYIVPEGSDPEELRLHGNGTGPFKQKRFEPAGDLSIFVKNEDYWQEGLPKADVIELVSITEGPARAAALLTGDIDIATLIDPAGLAQLEASSEVKVISKRSPYLLNIAYMCDEPPFDDNRVRLALKYAVDRQAMVDTVLLGRGNLANDHPVASWLPYAWQVEPREQDISKAKELLAEAGYPDGLDLGELWTADACDGMVELAQVFKAMAEEAGIEFTVQVAPSDVYWSEFWNKKPFHIGCWSGRRAEEALFAAYHSEAPWNHSHFRNPEFDQLIEEARQTVDYDERSRLYQEAQKLLSEEGCVIIPFFMDVLAATRADIVGWEPHPSGFMKDYRFVERKR